MADPTKKYYGAGVKWGIGTTGLTGTGVAVFIPQSISVKKESGKKEIKDGNGEVKAVIYYDFKKTASIKVIPSGSTLAASATNNVLPDCGTKITVVDTTDADLAGDWLCDSASKDTSGEEGQMSFEMTQYGNSAVQTAVT